VPWFLVTHPRGNVVIDGGNAAECAIDAAGHWGAIFDVYRPAMTPEQACVPALRDAGFDPVDVAYILQSHLHLDHTGAIGAIDEFPNARVLVTRAEYEYAYAPDWFAAGAYIRADYDKPGVPWVLLTVDAAYTTDHWEERALPGFLASAVDAARSVRKLRRIAERSGSTVVTGHDPVAWPGFRHAPEFYA
jgi:N-acyl homoserine lactone hydrolase